MFRRHDRQVLLMAVVLLGATVLSNVRIPGAPLLGGILGDLLAPAQSVLTGVASSVNGVVGGTRDVDKLRSRLAEIESEYAVLQTANTKLGELKQENDSLRALLAFKRTRIDLDLRGASIVARKVAEEPGSLMHTVWLDVGTRQGVKRGMPVANDRGLVGQVVEADANRCAVQLILDPASRVVGRIQRSRATGIVVGTTTGQLVMRYIPQDLPGAPHNVQVGDVVVTSGLLEEGLAQRFPPEVPLGQVIEVRQSDVDTHQEAIVRPTVDFNGLEQVLVVYGWSPDGADARSGADGAARTGAQDSGAPSTGLHGTPVRPLDAPTASP
jgi:rod shape-determining protein MreC